MTDYRDGGMGADPLAAMTSDLTDRVTAAILPKLENIVKQAAEASAPTVENMIYSMLPTLGLYALLGIGIGSVVSAGIGSYYATKVRRRGAA